MATLRVDMGTSARSWVMWAKNRLSAAAAIAVQISPSTRATLVVSKACRLAYDFHSLNSNSLCQTQAVKMTWCSLRHARWTLTDLRRLYQREDIVDVYLFSCDHYFVN